ncbi:MAG: hypothetical protein AAGJ83_14675, partial [Planctomycetota bacterium]
RGDLVHHALQLRVDATPEVGLEFDTDEIDGRFVCGTVGFMAPEQAIGRDAIDGRADLFSLGSTLYYLLTGEMFCSGDTVAKRLQNTRSGENWKSLNVDSVPEPLRRCLSKMLVFDREDRYADISEALEELKKSARELGFVIEKSIIHVLIIEPNHDDPMSIFSQLVGNPSLRLKQVTELSEAADAIWFHTESSALPLIVLVDCRSVSTRTEELSRRLNDWKDEQVHVLGVIDESTCSEEVRSRFVECIRRDSIADHALERAIFTVFGRLPHHRKLTTEA